MGDAEAAIAERYRLMSSELNERQRRRFAACEARTFGYGGIAAAARACGVAENTVPVDGWTFRFRTCSSTRSNSSASKVLDSGYLRKERCTRLLAPPSSS